MWGWVGLHGRPWVGGCGPCIDEPMSSGDPQRATIKAHHPSTQPPSPLRNPRSGFRLMHPGHPLAGAPGVDTYWAAAAFADATPLALILAHLEKEPAGN